MKITSNYGWNEDVSHCHNYIDREVVRALSGLGAKRILDVGCGNGSLAGFLQGAGYYVAGCEPDEDGVEIARKAHPKITFVRASVYDPPPFAASSFDAVISTEVIEHLYAPEALPQFAARVLRKGGWLIISTPYHGYFKNLFLALLNKWDFHHHPCATGGHIKYFSRATLSRLLAAEGFTLTGFAGCGRLPYLWKSMLLIAQWDGGGATGIESITS